MEGISPFMGHIFLIAEGGRGGGNHIRDCMVIKSDEARYSLVADVCHSLSSLFQHAIPIL